MTHTRLPLKLIALAAAALLIVSIGAAGQAANGGKSKTADKPKGTADPARVEVGIRMQESSAAVSVLQAWQGEDAKELRQSLDTYFGERDGTLGQAELDKISRATEADMRGKSLTWLKLDGAALTIQNVTVTFLNATGAATESTSIEMVHDVTLALPAANGSVERKLQVMPMWDGTLSVTAPAGLTVGKDGEARSEQTATEPMVKGERVLLGVGPAVAPTPVTSTPAQPTPTAATATTPTTPQEAVAPPGDGAAAGGRAIPGPALALLAAAAAFVAVALGRRRG